MKLYNCEQMINTWKHVTMWIVCIREVELKWYNYANKWLLLNQPIGLDCLPMNGPRDRDSVPGQVIPNTQKIVLDASLLNTQHYKVWIKGKWSNPRTGVVPSPTLWCSSYWKWSLWVTQLTYLKPYNYVWIISVR